MMKAFFLFLFTTLAWGQARHDRFANCPADPTWEITKVVKWGEGMDLIGNRGLRSRSAGEMMTKFGNPVDLNCYHGLSPAKWKQRLQRMEAAIAYAMTQSQRCWSTLGFGGATGTITILRRVRFHCSSNEGLAASAASGILTSPTYDHNYEMTDWGGYMDTQPMESVGSTLFHEALHWSVANNTAWHNHTHDHPRAGCDKSLFEDRVYLMEAACFPKSDVGQQFYNKENGAFKCANVCKDALMKSDKNAQNWAVRNLQIGSSALYGHKYKKGDARIICDRVKEIPKRYAKSRKDLKALAKKNKMALLWAKDNFGESEQGKILRVMLSELTTISQNCYDPSFSYTGLLKLFKDKQKLFNQEVKRTCESRPTEVTLSAFCHSYTFQNNPMTNFLDEVHYKLERVNPADFNLYTPAPRPDHEVTLY